MTKYFCQSREAHNAKKNTKRTILKKCSYNVIDTTGKY